MKVTSDSLLSFLRLTVLVFGVIFGTRAHSVPRCSDLLQGHPAHINTVDTTANASVAGLSIQSLVGERIFTHYFFENVFSLSTDFSLGYAFLKPARLHISVEANERSIISITPTNPNHIGTAQKKLVQIREELFEFFNHSKESREITGPLTTKDPLSGETSVSISFERGISEKKIQMTAYIARRLLKMKPLAVLPYWELMIAEPRDNGKIYHVPEHLKNHSPPSGLIGRINHKAFSYAIPVNLPRDVYAYFRDSNSYKFILSSSLWTVESVYKTPEGTLKTLALEVTPEGALLLDFTSYAARPPLESSSYLYHEIIKNISEGSFNAVTHSPEGSILKRLHVKTDRLLDFFKELKDAGYELQPPGDKFLSPAGKPVDNLSRFRP